MKVSFTGSSYGMNGAQFTELTRLVIHFGIHHGIHGGCVGADNQFHELCKKLGATTEVWPCDIAHMQFDFSDATLVHPVQRPLIRNSDIVRSGEVLIATPAGGTEIVRGRDGGTWATVRRARFQGKIRWIIPPSGIAFKELRG